LSTVAKLLSPTGIALIASKRFYFGVGGGTYTLNSLVEEAVGSSAITGTSSSTNSTHGSASVGLFQLEVLEVFEDGASNVREIIKLQRLPGQLQQA
jgi:hypothetical protein